MNFEKYLRQEQIKKDATEAASKSVNDIVGKMMRSEFEKLFKTTEAYKILEEMNYFKIDLFTFKEHRNQYQHSAVQIAYMTYQHQQSKLDELQKRVDAALTILSSKKKMYVDMFIELEQALKGDQ